MDILNWENIIASYMTNTKQATITQEKIHNIKKELQKLFENSWIFIYIDTTRGTLMNTMDISPDLFERNQINDTITCKDINKLEEETKWYFDAKIPWAIKNKYKEFMEQIT